MDGRKKEHICIGSTKNGKKSTKLRRRKKIANYYYTRHRLWNVMDFWAYL